MNEDGAETPLLSIVIPAFNRARLVRRAIDSCLAQDFGDFEVVVVDDGSTDCTAAQVGLVPDPRVRLVLHEKNCGVCAARNTGVDAARGQWLVLLDSDDELLPGALQVIRRRIAETPAEVRRHIFMYELDTGGQSPNPPLADELWDCERFLKWASQVRGSTDFLNVISRSAFRQVRFPDGRVAEPLFHLDFASSFLTRTCPAVVAVVHSDASNRSKNFSIDRLLGEASDNAAGLELLLSRHGRVLREWAPSLYLGFVSGRMTSLFLAGRRREAVAVAAQVLRLRISLRTIVILVVGLMGPAPLAWLKIRLT